jgi:hypothetical protein
MKGFKYFISINQYAAYNNFGEKLDYIDLALFDFMKAFMSSKKSVKLIWDGVEYTMLKKDMIISQMPLIGIKTERGILNRIGKLVEVGLIEQYPNNKKESVSFYKLGANADKLEFSQDGNTDAQEETPKEQNTEEQAVSPDLENNFQPKNEISKPLENIFQGTRNEISQCAWKNFSNYNIYNSNNEIIDKEIIYNNEHAQNFSNFDACEKEGDSNQEKTIEIKPIERDKPQSVAGGAAEKKQKPKADPDKTAKFNGIKSIFLEHYKQTKGLDYYFAAKDAGAVSQLVRKLEAHIRTHNGTDTADREEVCNTFSVMIEKIKDNWIIDNLSLTLINSKYNEIISQINGKSNNTLKKGDVDFAEVGKLIWGDNGDGSGLVELDLFGKKRRKREQEHNDNLSRNVG